MPSRDKDTIIERMNVTENNLNSRHSDWKTYWKLYKSVTEDDMPTISQNFIPMIFTIVETLMPRIVSSITGTDPIISTLPRTADDVKAAKVLESLQQFQLMKMNFEQKLIPIVRDALIMDVGVAKLQWDIRDDYRGPWMEYVNPFEIFPDPHAKSVEDAKYIMQRYFIDKETLQGWEDQMKVGTRAGGESIDNISESRGRDQDDDAQQIRLQSIGQSVHTDTTQDWVEVIEHWEDDHVQFIANENTMIRDEENPYEHGQKPFHFFADYPQGDSIFGQGEVENLEDLQHEINEKRNQRIDSVNMQLSPPVIKSPSALLDDEEMVVEPYAVWTANPDDIAFPQMPDVTPPAVREEQMAQQNMREVSAVTSVIQGVSSQNNPSTATGFNTLDQNAASRFTLKVRSFEKPIQDMAHQMHKLNMQFQTPQSMIRIVGEVDETIQDQVREEGRFKFLEFSPEEIRGNFDFVARGAKSETKRQRQQRMIQLINSIAPIATEVNLKEMFRELFRSFNVKDVDRFLEVPQEQVDRLQQQGSGEQREGRGESTNERNQNSDSGSRPTRAGDEESASLGALQGGLR